MPFLKIYIASSLRNINTIRFLSRALKEAGHTVLAYPDRSHDSRKACELRASACGSADLVMYVGEADQDAGVEVGIAWAAGVPVLGICGPLEHTGLMLSGAVSAWISPDELLDNLGNPLDLLPAQKRPGSETPC